MIQIQDSTGQVLKTAANAKQARNLVLDARKVETDSGLSSQRLTAVDASTGFTVAGPGVLGKKLNGRTARAKARKENAGG